MKSKILNPKSKRNPKSQIQSDPATSFRTPVLIALAFLVAVAGRLDADVIVLKDGKTIEGTIVDGGETYEVTTKYGTLKIRKEDVSRVVQDAAALKAEADVLRGVAASLAEDALKGGVAAEVRDRKLSAAEEAMQKALALYQDARSIAAADAAAGMDAVMADLKREITRVREKRGADALPAPAVLEVPLPPPPMAPLAKHPPPQFPRPPGLAGLKPGLKAEYFTGIDLKTPAVSWIDLNINCNWGAGPAWAGGPADYFSARWTGFLLVPKSGRYTFELMADDGFELFIDGVKLMGVWEPQTPTLHSAAAALQQGLHKFQLTYFEGSGSAMIRLGWRQGDGPAEVIPHAAFFHAPSGAPPKPPNPADLKPGLRAEYFKGIDLKTLALSRVDPTIDFNWAAGPAWGGGPVDGFSACWSGYLHVPRSGRYAFEIHSDDGMELMIDNLMIKSCWMLSAATFHAEGVELEEGFHKFMLIYFEGAGNALVRLRWGEGDGPLQVVAASHFFHSPSESPPKKPVILQVPPAPPTPAGARKDEGRTGGPTRPPAGGARPRRGGG
jgi:hypothetical protein